MDPWTRAQRRSLERAKQNYGCTTIGEPIEFEYEDERVSLPAGAILCEVWTNDNLDRGYPSEDAAWKTWARDRAAFDRIVGKSRRGIGCDVTVILDGDRVE